jgi:hypothetical protein
MNECDKEIVKPAPPPIDDEGDSLGDDFEAT